MAKPQLYREDAILESQIIETLLAGHHQWRADLPYPQSHSDMQGAVRGLLQLFKVERRSLPAPLRIACDPCRQSGELIIEIAAEGRVRRVETCTHCNGRGWSEG